MSTAVDIRVLICHLFESSNYSANLIREVGDGVKLSSQTVLIVFLAKVDLAFFIVSFLSNVCLFFTFH